MVEIDVEQFRVDPASFPGLDSIPTDSNGGLDKSSAKPLMKALNGRLEELQENLYAHGRERLLVVLQATDTGGKDGTIRAVFDGTNPQGVHVASFKKPTDEELAHDYLWRIHPHVPGKGDITIFNRSHYEDVLVVRVHDLVPEDRWRKRYGHIRDFEQMLVDEGMTIRKVYLHISPEEQRERLQARVDDPAKHWKFSFGDLDERKLWDDYQAAFAEMLTETSTADAPWYVIPADRKWYRNLVITRMLVNTLEEIAADRFPPNPELDGLVIE
ncbi:MAG: polyphosphate kinase 2 family protein [Acidimicrobiales bacterium]